MVTRAQLSLHPATISQVADLDERAAIIGGAGFGAWSLRGREIQAYLDGGRTLEALAAVSAQHGLAVSDVGALNDWQWSGHPPVVNRQVDPASRSSAELWQLVERFFGHAAALGGTTIVAVGPRHEVGALDAAVALFGEICDRATPFGLRIAYEVLASSATMRTYERAWELVRRADRQNGGLALDMFHFLHGGSSLDALLRVPVDRVFLVRITDSTPAPAGGDTPRLLPGDGAAPLREVVGWLARGGYAGYYSIEAPNPEHLALPAADVARRAARAAAALLGLEDADHAVPNRGGP